MADVVKPLNWTRVFNVCCATILVGAETVGGGAAAGWALAGMLKMGDVWVNGFLYAGAVAGLFAAVAFFRAAKRNEPWR